MKAPNPHSWHHKIWVRAVLLLLVPVMIASLYLLTHLFALRRPPSSPRQPAHPEAAASK